MLSHTVGYAGDMAGWIGEWHSGKEKKITISASASGDLLINGEATFGADDPDRIASGSINTGTFSVRWDARQSDDQVIAFSIDGDKAVDFEDGDQFACRIRMVLSGDYLDATDNGECGGLNVTFTGRYLRAK